MIGVACRSGQEHAVEEFFELFKTPWEAFAGNGNHEVVITTDPGIEVPPAKLTIVFGSSATRFDLQEGIFPLSREEQVEFEWIGLRVPIYRMLAAFPGAADPILPTREGKSVGVVREQSGRTILRIGYDLFDEVDHLLQRGQPAEKAQIPTMDLHIAMLRSWILRAGIPVAEIPPVPFGYDFATCLTHDIDFMGIRDHKFDHSMFGFIYRSLVPKYLKGLDRKTARARYWKNLRAVISLPLVHAGIIPDFWYPLDRYAQVEEGLKSTFFFIPFPNRHGKASAGDAPRYRAARYDVARYREPIRSLVQGGLEADLHGIDSWRDSKAGREELEAIRGITGEEKIGVRMHWLYHSDETPSRLEEAGFYFDSSLGYNEAVGYRNGTSQVFRLPGTAGVFELPLHLQDTAMFYPGRMNLTEPQAMALCRRLVDNFKEHGGVFTINWHDRSLAPERNWDVAYKQLLGMLRMQRTWFATAKEAVAWFEMRRSLRFGPSGIAGGVPEVKMGPVGPAKGPPATLRVHRPAESWGDRGSLPGLFTEYPLDSGEERAVGC